MKKILLLLAVFLVGMVSYGQKVDIEQPKTETGVRFAVVIDSKTFQKCKKEVYNYRDALEKDGLSTYIISGEWENPDQVKEEIKRVYAENPKNFEGIVLVGDIPVVMVRNAQNLTRSFKMDENKFEKGRSSVPSDRFYDDLGLEFEFLTKSSNIKDAGGRELFFYNLSAGSKQYLSPDFYSGRILFPNGFKGDKYKEIGKFLDRAAAAHLAPPQMKNMLLSRGALSENEDFYARIGGIEMIKDQVPFLARPNAIQVIDFNKDTPSQKDRLMEALKQPQNTVFYYRGHGNYAVMAPGFSAAHGSTAEIKAAEMLKNPTQAYYVMLNSCFNGSIFKSQDMAPSFLFSPGNVLAVQSVGINSHQDEWEFRYAGIIYGGARVGECHRLAPLLERNLFGDPTFHFKSVYNYDLKDFTVKNTGNEEFWRYAMEKGLPLGVEGDRNNSITCVAVNRLCRMDKLSSSDLAKLWGKRLSPSVLLECVLQTYDLYGKGCDTTVANDLLEILNEGILSQYEFVVRHSGMAAKQFADPRLEDALINSIKYNLKRTRAIRFVAEALSMIPENEMLASFANHPLSKDPTVAKYIEDNKKVLYKQKRIQHLVITDKNTGSDRRILHSLGAKNNPFPDYIPLFVSMVEDESLNTELRFVQADLLGWYEYSYKKKDVVDAIKRMLSNPSFDATMRNSLNNKVSLRDVLTKSLNRLEKTQ
ncbi:MAG: hypothetical protein J6Z32_07500 [Bacteroidales bacterium]|nr:hypothetical protein [Bacteroidales bacterium]